MGIDLISLVIVLIIVGVLLWAVQQLPMDATIKTVIRVVVIAFVIIWLLQALVPLHPVILRR